MLQEKKEPEPQQLRPAKKLKRMNTTGHERKSSPKFDVKLEDFNILKVIDKGSFGKVFLVELRSTGKLYAMKRIRKDILIEKGQIDNTYNERDILLKTEHPFLLGMDYVFQNEF